MTFRGTAPQSTRIAASSANSSSRIIARVPLILACRPANSVMSAPVSGCGPRSVAYGVPCSCPKCAPSSGARQRKTLQDPASNFQSLQNPASGFQDWQNGSLQRSLPTSSTTFLASRSGPATRGSRANTIRRRAPSSKCFGRTTAGASLNTSCEVASSRGGLRSSGRGAVRTPMRLSAPSTNLNFRTARAGGS